MITGSQLKQMPANHEFAKGDCEIPELHPELIRWVAIWGGMDWCIKVSAATKNFQEVRERGRIVDIQKFIQQIVPCDSEAMELYRK